MPMPFIENFPIYMQFYWIICRHQSVGSLPIFMSMTSNQYQEAERQKTMLVTSTLPSV